MILCSTVATSSAECEQSTDSHRALHSSGLTDRLRRALKPSLWVYTSQAAAVYLVHSLRLDLVIVLLLSFMLIAASLISCWTPLLCLTGRLQRFWVVVFFFFGSVRLSSCLSMYFLFLELFAVASSFCFYRHFLRHLLPLLASRGAVSNRVNKWPRPRCCGWCWSAV